jgi:hypothetical protein
MSEGDLLTERLRHIRATSAKNRKRKNNRSSSSIGEIVSIAQNECLERPTTQS